MAHALPVTKLAGLVVKTLAKPLSKRIKSEFSQYDVTKRLLIGIGQVSNNVTSRMTMWSAGYQVKHIKPLDPDKALVTGAEFVGESFILLVSIGVLMYEVQSTNEKTRVKDEKERALARAERKDLQAKLHAIDVRLKAVEDVVRAQSSLLLLGPKYKPPDQRDVVPLTVVDDDDDDDDDDDVNNHNHSPSAGLRVREDKSLGGTASIDKSVSMKSIRRVVVGGGGAPENATATAATATGAPVVPENQQTSLSEQHVPWWRKWMPWSNDG